MPRYTQLAAIAIVGTAIVALAATDVQAQQKKKPKAAQAAQPVVATENDYAWASYNKGLAGTVLAFDGNTSVTVRVTYTNLEPNPKYKPPVLNRNARGYNSQSAMHHHNYQRYRSVHQQYHNHRGGAGQSAQQAMQAQMRLYQQMMQMQMQLMQAQMRMAQQMNAAIARANSNPNNQPFKQVAHAKDFTLDLQDNAVFRKTYLPFEYDDEGNPKKYSTAEKAALKGSDKSKPGYSATVQDLQVGATANFYLTPPKKKTKAADELIAGPNHPTVNMVVLTKEASPDSSPVPVAAKKKNKK